MESLLMLSWPFQCSWQSNERGTPGEDLGVNILLNYWRSLSVNRHHVQHQDRGYCQCHFCWLGQCWRWRMPLDHATHLHGAQSTPILL
jgi:hypothetical protein